ncbi:MAG TPA: glycosyltransferase family 4 protein [Burkholderiales bacterium]
MRILLLSQYFWPENFLINDVVAGLVERGHEVLVYTGLPNYPAGRYFDGYGASGPFRQQYRGAQVRRVPLVPRGGGGALRLVLNYLSFAGLATLLAPVVARGRFDVILVYEPSPMTIGIPARALRVLERAPLAFWVQDLWPESLSATGSVRNRAILRLVEALIRWIYRGCDLVLVQSEAFIPSVEAHGVPRGRIRYLPNSADALYRRVPAAADDAEASELPRGFRLMYAGNIGAAQDFPTILAAAERLRAREDIQWIVLGDGRMRPWVEEEVRRRGLAATFHLLGARAPERMPRYFAHADVLLATLRREPIFAYTIPSKIQSYIACGRPVIAALEGEGGRIIRDARAGWVVPPEDPKALADAVLAARALARPELDAMGSRGEAWFREHFEREKLLSRLESFLSEMSK